MEVAESPHTMDPTLGANFVLQVLPLPHWEMCEGASEMMMYMLNVTLLNVSSKMYCLCRYILILCSCYIVEQLSQGPSFSLQYLY